MTTVRDWPNAEVASRARPATAGKVRRKKFIRKKTRKLYASAALAGGRSDNFCAGPRFDSASGTSSFPPFTAILPSDVCRKRGRDFVSRKVECARNSPFNPTWE